MFNSSLLYFQEDNNIIAIPAVPTGDSECSRYVHKYFLRVSSCLQSPMDSRYMFNSYSPVSFTRHTMNVVNSKPLVLVIITGAS